MLALIGPILSMVSDFLPAITSGAVAADSTVTALEQIVPLAISTGTALLPAIQSIIASLTGGATLTAAQLATLQALDAQCDAAFEAAATAAGDPAPSA